MDEATMYAHLASLLRRIADELDDEIREWLQPPVIKTAQPEDDSGVGKRDTPLVFRGMASRYIAASCARRVASMAAKGGYDDNVLPKGWALRSDVIKPTDEMLDEMVAGREKDWENLAAIATRLYEKGGWPESVLATYLALIAPGWDIERPDVQDTIRRLTRNNGGEKLTAKELKRDFRRLLSWAEMDDATVVEPLRYWAGHCSWAHESVRATDE